MRPEPDAPQVLQLCPLLPELEHALAERFTVHRWFEADAPEALLGAHGTAIRAVVTGGHLGLPDELAARLPALEIVAINGVGFDKVDLAEARARGFRVTNTPDVLTDDVADLAIGLVIALLRRIPEADRHVRAGRWPEAEVPLGRKVSAQRFGILGLGRIGKAIARRLEGFGVSIAYTDLAAQDVPYTFHPTPTALAHAVDVLIVAAAAGTRPLIDRSRARRAGARRACSSTSPAARSSTRRRWSRRCRRAGSAGPRSTSSPPSRACPRPCGRCPTSCSPRTSRAPPSTPAARWPSSCWPTSTPTSAGQPLPTAVV